MSSVSARLPGADIVDYFTTQQPQLRSKFEALVLAIHAHLLTHSFKCTGLSNNQAVAATDTTALPPGWNNVANSGVYIFQYRHSKLPNEAVIIMSVTLGISQLSVHTEVHLINDNQQSSVTSSPKSFSLNVNTYISNDATSYATLLTNLGGLAAAIDLNIVSKLVPADVAPIVLSIRRPTAIRQGTCISKQALPQYTYRLSWQELRQMNMNPAPIPFMPPGWQRPLLPIKWNCPEYLLAAVKDPKIGTSGVGKSNELYASFFASEKCHPFVRWADIGAGSRGEVADIVVHGRPQQRKQDPALPASQPPDDDLPPPTSSQIRSTYLMTHRRRNDQPLDDATLCDLPQLVDPKDQYRYQCPFQHGNSPIRVGEIDYVTEACGERMAALQSSNPRVKTTYRIITGISSIEQHLKDFHDITILYDDPWHRNMSASGSAIHDALIDSATRRESIAGPEVRTGIQVKTCEQLYNEWATKYPPGMIMWLVNTEHTVYHICFAEDCNAVAPGNYVSHKYRIALHTEDPTSGYRTQLALQRRVAEVTGAYIQMSTVIYEQIFPGRNTEMGYHTEEIYKRMMSVHGVQTVTASTADSVYDTTTAGYHRNQHKTFHEQKRWNQKHIPEASRRYSVTISRYGYWDSELQKPVFVKYTTADNISSIVLHSNKTLLPEFIIPADIAVKYGLVSLQENERPTTLTWPVHADPNNPHWLDKELCRKVWSEDELREAEQYKQRPKVKAFLDFVAAERTDADTDNDRVVDSAEPSAQSENTRKRRASA